MLGTLDSLYVIVHVNTRHARFVMLHVIVYVNARHARFVMLCYSIC